MLLQASTLRRRMIISLGLMVMCSLAIGVGSIIAVNGLHQDLGISVQGYRQLRQLFSVGFLTSKAREEISANPPRPDQAVIALQSAVTVLNQPGDPTTIDGPPMQWVDESSRKDCQRLLSESMDQLNHGSHNPASLNLIFARIEKIAGQVRQSIADAQDAADRKRQIALTTIICLCGLVVIGAIVIGIRQYRRVIGPVAKIGDGVRAFAKGNFDQRIEMTGDREFIALAADFNKMADELSALYRDLEDKVQAKSKQLVRSERLAGVGYLAAGVAHEINNPLGIIAGYAERAIQQLSNGVNDETLPKTQKAFSVICEEAFRCKQIIDRLLSLARPGAETRQVISIATVAEAVVSTLSGLGSTKTLDLHYDCRIDLRALADEAEMKQLILNLVINAMEAIGAEGKVSVEINRRADEIELSVIDNGVGMTPATIEQVFQPFFTDKRAQRPGTGLGLSIAQAIVIDHGGRIEARSAGPNTGSSFIVHLPAVQKEGEVASLQ